MALKAFATKYGKTAVTKPLYIYETWLRLIGRGLQLIFALIVVGLYGSRVNSDRSAGNPQASQWVYALFIASLSAITTVLFAIPQPFVKTARLFAWDLVLFVLWIAVFGVFAVLFLRMPHDDQHKWYQGVRVSTMRVAVWIDLVNALFWLLTGGYGCFRTFVSRKVDEKIDGKLEQIESKVSSKVSDKFGDRFAESNVGAKFGAATNVASKVMPHVAPKFAPKLNKFTEIV
ncbi:hypothetical protein GGR51DRAFT_557790 [Nemania sp. FL0031]|nr:hypothetical protein GGR51DRAFT_557790 [Nemania sp. FL0031]